MVANTNHWFLDYNHGQKQLRHSPKKTCFVEHITSRKRSTNQQKQLRNHAFHVKTSQSAKS